MYPLYRITQNDKANYNFPSLLTTKTFQGMSRDLENPISYNGMQEQFPTVLIAMTVHIMSTRG